MISIPVGTISKWYGLTHKSTIYIVLSKEFVNREASVPIYSVIVMLDDGTVIDWNASWISDDAAI